MRLTIDQSLCIGCGAAESVAPGLVQLRGRKAQVVSQPQDELTVRSAEIVEALCPVGAIRLDGLR
jgi:ferredoxin